MQDYQMNAILRKLDRALDLVERCVAVHEATARKGQEQSQDMIKNIMEKVLNDRN